MASADNLRILRQLQTSPDNRICSDCETKNPQWASVSYGTFFCLECSGRHRSLGVHLSFVRSVSMDAWSNDQLKKMQCGGNAKMNAFFKQYGVEKSIDIVEKYNSKAAEFYREKLKAEVEGRPYTAPNPSSVPKPAARGSSMAASRSGGGNGGKKDDWGDWGDEGKGRGGQGTGSNAGFSGKSEYTASQYEAPAKGKEEFFARTMQENANKPENLNPNQGGKYVGFGSSPMPKSASSRQGDDVSALLSSGLSSVSLIAQSAASTTSTYLRAGSQSLSKAVNDGQISENASVAARVASERAAAAAQSGWLSLKSIYAGVASTVEQAAKSQGYQVDLGARTVAASLQEQQARAAMLQQASVGREYGGDSSARTDGYGSVSGNEEQGNGNSGGGGGTGGMGGSSGAGAGSMSRGGGGSNSNFAGFDEGADNGWSNNDDDAWGPANGGNSGSAKVAAKRAGSGKKAVATHKSQSTPAFSKDEEDGEWGKW
eukprot:gene13017-3523_t